MIKSIILPILVSLFMGGIGYFSNQSFLPWFGLTLVIQYLIFFIVNLFIKVFIQLKLNQLEIERLNEIDKNKTVVKCATCKEVNDVLINIKNVDNDFRCVKCNSLNNVIVNIQNFQKTEFYDGIITEESIKEELEQKEKEKENN